MWASIHSIPLYFHIISYLIIHIISLLNRVQSNGVEWGQLCILVYFSQLHKSHSQFGHCRGFLVDINNNPQQQQQSKWVGDRKRPAQRPTLSSFVIDEWERERGDRSPVWTNRVDWLFCFFHLIFGCVCLITATLTGSPFPYRNSQ